MLEHRRLINLGQYLVLVLNVRVVDLSSWALELQLRITYDVLNNLLFNTGLVIWFNEANLIAWLKSCQKSGTNAFDCDLILKFNLSNAGFGEVL